MREPLLIVKEVSGELRNAELPMLATELGISREVRVAAANALPPMLVKEEPKVRLFNGTAANAEVPMVVTESGTLSEVRFVKEKAPLPIEIKPLGRVTPVRGAESKANSSILRTEESSVTFPAQLPPGTTVPEGSEY